MRLFTRTPRGAELTGDGGAFLPHARELLQVQERAVAAAAARPPSAAGRRDRPARRRPRAAARLPSRPARDGELEVVALVDAGEAFAALRDGTLDATFRALPERRARRPRAHARPRRAAHAADGPDPPARRARPASACTTSRGHRIWIPGIVEGSEWGAFYDELAAAFGLSIDALGPNFGTDAMLEALAGSATVATFAGEQPGSPPARPPPHRRARPDARLPALARLARRQPAPGARRAARPPRLGRARAGHVDVQRVLKASRQSSRDSPSIVKRHS